ncbi:hypothetical protein EDD17DRAFT_907624 [Pisolithus thermaeus]|nr:hypothetical protein EV401DRAFT_2068943 [Pisolithus croceorrhizus]KAI6159254.1 hypothetical protein EDD17DRAFT_907624 [Pisolithus thermaeus]
MLHLLPVEIALQVVSYLPIQTLHQLVQVSRAWHDLIAVNESTVYRNAAILHRLVQDENCDNLVSQASRLEINWKSFCRREFQIEWGWRGKAPSYVEELSASGTSVHRIKVDEDSGLVITTSQRGGLLVTNLKGNAPLWGLPPSHVVESAHCEYDHGYIVFNRLDNCKEVWRRVVDADNEDHCTESPPDADMLSAWTEGISRWDASTRHGHFKPWALLRMPEHTRAFRLSHLTLLASATENAYLWDVSQGRLIETICDIQRWHHDQTLGHIQYVEVNDKYAFICGSSQLRIFERGGGALVYDLSPKNLVRKVWNILSFDEHPAPNSSIVKRQKLQQSDLTTSSSADDQFMAVHVSGNGKDIVALTVCGVLIIVPGFQRLISGEAVLSNIAVQLRFPPNVGHLQDTAIYLALSEKDGKVAAAMCRGLYLVSPDIEFSNITTECPPRPGVVVSRLTKFEDMKLLSFVSCLQITRTSIYFNWKPSRPDTQLNRGGGNNGYPMLAGGPIGNPPMNIPPLVVQPQMGPPTHNNQHPNNTAATAFNDHDNEDEADVGAGGFFGHSGDLPHLEPATFELDEYDEDEEYEEEDEYHEDFDADFMDEFFDAEGGPFEHPMHGHWNPVMVHVGEGDPDGGMHVLINEWFLPMNMSTVYRVSF